MSNLEKFKKLEKPGKKSKLSKYHNEISNLIEDGYTVKQVHKYLIEIEKVEVNLDYLYKYIRKLNTKELAKGTPNKPKSEPKQEEKKEDQEEVKKEDEKPKVDPFEALRKLQEEDKKKGITKREVPYWEPQKKPWEK